MKETYIHTGITKVNKVKNIGGVNYTFNGTDYDGYLVELSNGTKTYYSKEQFEKEFHKLQPNENLKTKYSIGKEMVEQFIVKYDVSTINQKTTLVTATLKNGFEITETSSCVDVNNYDEKLGAQYCKEKIISKVWEYLGFLLQCSI